MATDYTVNARCTNCGWAGEATIPTKKLVTEEGECPTCECDNVLILDE